MKKICMFSIFLLFTVSVLPVVSANLHDNNKEMIVRISEVEVYPEYLEEYFVFAKEVAEVSVKKEKGVIAIYPMALIRDNNQIRILEIYKDKHAYNKHIASEHFQKYKKGTLHMVKTLDLIDNYQLSPVLYRKIFKKAI